jgi:lipopolysaccharide transport system permease protein
MYKNLAASIITNRQFVLEMAKRDLKGLNKGAFLGFLWVIINPLIQVLAYVIIVSLVFRSRLSANSGPFDYALYVLSGMIPWQIITKSLQEAPSLIRERMELVKQVVYPVETLPLSSLIFGSFGSIVSFSVFFVVSILSGNVHWTCVFLPVPFLLLAGFILGVSWLFSIVGVLIKDLREIVTIILSLIIYLSPVVASREIVGEKVWRLILLNPLAHIIVCFRDVFNSEFHTVSWIIFVSLAVSSLLLGGWVVMKAKTTINEYI